MAARAQVNDLQSRSMSMLNTYLFASSEHHTPSTLLISLSHALHDVSQITSADVSSIRQIVPELEVAQ